MDYSAELRGGMPVHVEVKAVTTDLPLAHISENERRLLARFTAWGHICALFLQVYPRGLSAYRVTDCAAAWLIPWCDWLTVESALAKRAAGRYQGYSWRAAQDSDLITQHALERRGNRWVLCAGHWASVYAASKASTRR